MNDTLLVWGLTALFWTWVWFVLRGGVRFGCLFGHRAKRYVAAHFNRHPVTTCYSAYCHCGDNRGKSWTMAAWVCYACKRQGEQRLDQGRWKVHLGELIPDEKALANPTEVQ